MAIQPQEYPSSPFVTLRLAQKLTPDEIAAVTAANATADPETSFREAILAYRAFAMQHASEELMKATVLDGTVIRTSMDYAWEAFSPVFKKATGPMIAEAYINAFKAT